MELRKLAPWNWFKNEEEHEHAIPVTGRGKRYSGTTSPYNAHSIIPDFDRYLHEMFHSDRGMAVEPASLFKPSADLRAEDEAYILSIEIPGVDEKDVSIDVFDNTMTIRGEKKQEIEEKNSNYYRIERSYGSFQRILSLPGDVDQDKIRAKIKKGVLTVTMPRLEQESSTGKAIPITDG